MGHMASDRAAKVCSWLAAAAFAGNEPLSLGLLCRAVREHLDVDGASVTLMAHPDSATAPRVLQETLASTGARSAGLEELHLTLGEGPSADAFSRDTTMLIPDLHDSAADRWPGFVPMALDSGVAAIFALPFRAGANPAGVLTAHRAIPGALTPDDLADAGVFAHLALQLLLDGSSPDMDAEWGRTNGAAADRGEVHQAVGMTAVQLGVGMHEALSRLRAHAFAQDAPLFEVAREVTGRRLRLPPDVAPDSRPGE